MRYSKIFFSSLFFILIFVLIISIPVKASLIEHKISTTANNDAFVDSNNPGLNYGNSTVIYAGVDHDGHIKEAYLSFPFNQKPENM